MAGRGLVAGGRGAEAGDGQGVGAAVLEAGWEGRECLGEVGEREGVLAVGLVQQGGREAGRLQQVDHGLFVEEPGRQALAACQLVH